MLEGPSRVKVFPETDWLGRSVTFLYYICNICKFIEVSLYCTFICKYHTAGKTCRQKGQYNGWECMIFRRCPTLIAWITSPWCAVSRYVWLQSIHFRHPVGEFLDFWPEQKSSACRLVSLEKKDLISFLMSMKKIRDTPNENCGSFFKSR
jgi:hypothetical protein